MIYLDILGRCGNQMFQYAFAKRISELQNDEITINYSLMDPYREKYGDSFRDELCGFKAGQTFTKTECPALQIDEYGSLSQKIIFKEYVSFRKYLGRHGKDPHIAESKFCDKLAKYGIYVNCFKRAEPIEISKCNQKNIFIKGYFENPAYFLSYADELRELFSPVVSLNENDLPLLNAIKINNSVCISFRKWEVNGREICNREYYEKAIKVIKQKVENPQFVIFSNDIDWVKENFPLPDNCLFESGSNTIPEKVLLMSSCKHSIITNSTFCWWTQFLSDNPDKIVIMPEHWFEDETFRHPLTNGEYILI